MQRASPELDLLCARDKQADAGETTALDLHSARDREAETETEMEPTEMEPGTETETETEPVMDEIETVSVTETGKRTPEMGNFGGARVRAERAGNFGSPSGWESAQPRWGRRAG